MHEPQLQPRKLTPETANGIRRFQCPMVRNFLETAGSIADSPSESVGYQCKRTPEACSEHSGWPRLTLLSSKATSLARNHSPASKSQAQPQAHAQTQSTTVTPAARYQQNLKSPRRIDPAIVSIIGQFGHMPIPSGQVAGWF